MEGDPLAPQRAILIAEAEKMFLRCARRAFESINPYDRIEFIRMQQAGAIDARKRIRSASAESLIRMAKVLFMSRQEADDFAVRIADGVEEMERKRDMDQIS